MFQSYEGCAEKKTVEQIREEYHDFVVLAEVKGRKSKIVYGVASIDCVSELAEIQRRLEEQGIHTYKWKV